MRRSSRGGVPGPSVVVNAEPTAGSTGRIVRPNMRPGLGIEINEAEVKKHPFEQELPQRSFCKDGSVTDW